MNHIGFIVVSNLMFVLCTVPIVTIGAGWTALCYTFLRRSKMEEVNPFKEFIKGFKDNFKKATICFLLSLFIFAVLAVDWLFLGSLGGFYLKLRLVFVMIGVCVLIIALYIFPVISVFPVKLTELVKYSLYFAFRKPLYLIVILTVSTVPLIITYMFPEYFPLSAFIWFFFGFSVIAEITSSLLYKEFEPFLK